MIFFFIVSIHSVEWKLDQIIKPDIDNFGIFGRAVAVSSPTSNVIAVSASWETVGNQYKLGTVYVFRYDATQKEFVQSQKLIPSNTNNRVVLNNTGSTCKISSDGTRIVAGAPYSTVDGLAEVGALVVWDFNTSSNQFEQTAVIAPNASDVEEGQGLGRALTITSDGKTIASSYYNKPNFKKYQHLQGKVFISRETANGWSIPLKLEPRPEYAGQLLKFGSDLRFVDASHLLVATTLFSSFWEAGTMLYRKQSDTEWVIEQEIMPAQVTQYNLSNYGSPVSMPQDSQSILGLVGSYNTSLQTENPKVSGAFFILQKNQSGSGWETSPQQTVNFPAGIKLTGMDFCKTDSFITLGDNIPDPANASITHDYLYIYSRNAQQQFVQTSTIQPETNPPELLVFSSDVQWRSDCKMLVVGGMTKYPYDNTLPPSINDQPSNESRTYIYRIVETEESKGTDWVLILASIGGGVLFIAAVIFTVFYVRRNRSSQKEEAEYI